MRLITEDEDVDEWAVHLTVRDEAPVNLPGIHGRRRPRIDLEVERTQRGRHPRWRFEAKRLRNDTSVEAYMGSDGLGCYLVGRYAADQEEAGMLGYVQSQDEQTWAGQISDCIATNPGTCRVRTDGQWRGCDVVDGLDYCYSTKHDRDAPLGPIEVTHVLLRFH
ncbi:MAG TPA: hypothetical protein PLZ94_17250 [Armatimonadota bacterium]|nr:hypothetical protein [Armatimonadota bacterium]HPO74375.1 hypothetical protein [Armatimonadota bacterium]